MVVPGFATIPLKDVRAAHYDAINTAIWDEDNRAWEEAGTDATPGDGGDPVPVFDYVPDEDDPDEIRSKLPYVILGEQDWNSDHTKTAPSYEGGLRVHVWSVYLGGVEASEVAERAISALTDGLPLEGWELEILRMEEISEGPRIEAGIQVREATFRPACRLTDWS